MHLFKVTQHTR